MNVPRADEYNGRALVGADERRGGSDAANSATRRAFVYGYYGRGNFGDEALRAILAKTLADCGFSGAFSEPSPADGPAQSKMQGFKLRARRIWREWASTDVVILGGGGLLKDSSIAGGLSLSVSLLPIWGQLFLGRPLLIVGVGAGPIRDQRMHPWIRLLCELASGVFVRDPMSAQVLTTCGVDPSRIEIGADLFFVTQLPGAGAPPVDRELCVIALSDSDLYWYALEHGVDPREASRRIADAAVTIMSPMQHATLARLSAGDATFELGRTFEADLAVRGITADTVELDQADAEQMLSLMQRARVVLASRYHAVAAAAVAGTPVAVLALDPKCSNLADDLGVADATLDPDELFALGGGATAPLVQAVKPSPSEVNELAKRARRMVADAQSILIGSGTLRSPRLTDRVRVLEAAAVAVLWGAKRRLGRRRD